MVQDAEGAEEKRGNRQPPRLRLPSLNKEGMGVVSVGLSLEVTEAVREFFARAVKERAGQNCSALKELVEAL